MHMVLCTSLCRSYLVSISDSKGSEKLSVNITAGVMDLDIKMWPLQWEWPILQISRGKGWGLFTSGEAYTYIIIIKQETSVAENIFIRKGLLGHFASQKRTRSWSIKSKPSKV